MQKTLWKKPFNIEPCLFIFQKKKQFLLIKTNEAERRTIFKVHKENKKQKTSASLYSNSIRLMHNYKGDF
jgi:hypothetical protein